MFRQGQAPVPPRRLDDVNAPAAAVTIRGEGNGERRAIRKPVILSSRLDRLFALRNCELCDSVLVLPFEGIYPFQELSAKGLEAKSSLRSLIALANSRARRACARSRSASVSLSLTARPQVRQVYRNLTRVRLVRQSAARLAPKVKPRRGDSGALKAWQSSGGTCSCQVQSPNGRHD
jgi:hypothetical protein